MRTKKVVVVPYDQLWRSAFEDIRSELESAIGDLIVGIEHIGSTAVEGMSAKPCIDIDVIIKDYSVFDSVVDKLGSIGYIHEGNLGIKDREAFRYSDKPHLQTHHLYVCPQGSAELHRHVTFRDFLRSNPDAVRKYSEVKETAAELFPNDIDQYMEYKAPCIKELHALCHLDRDEQIAAWKDEEAIAHIHGWDFSHIAGRYTEQDDLPWDYRSVIGQYLTPEMRLLDIDTGGGEFLLSLHHPYEKTAATENYPPNVQLCKETLLPLGIELRAGDGKGKLPFEDGSFDIVINRHGDFNAEEIRRVLKPKGLFITQQVGAENDRELVELLCGKTKLPFPEQYLDVTARKFEDAGFTILRGEECFRPIKFFDVGALVWFARIIEWEFPDFSVENCLDNLLNAQRLLDEHGSIDGSIHRFLLVAQK